MRSALTIGFIGVWMAFVPALSMSSRDNLWNNWILGLIVTNVALVMTSRRRWERPLAVAAGIWLFISGFVPTVLANGPLTINSRTIGILLIACGVSAAYHWVHEPASEHVIDGPLG